MVYFKKQFKSILKVIFSQVISVVAFIPWVVYSPYYHRPKPSTWLAPPKAKEILDILIEYFNHTTIGLIFSLLFIVFVGIYTLQKKVALKNQFILWALLIWSLFPIISNFAISHFLVPIFTKRYMLFSTLGLYLLIPYVIWNLPLNRFIRGILGLSIVASFAFTVNTETFMGEDWRDSVNLIKQNKKHNSLVLVSPYFEFTSFAYYYNRDYYADYKNTLKLMTDEHVYMAEDSEIFSRVDEKKYDDVFILTAQTSQVSPEDMISALKKRRTAGDSIAFYGVNYYHFGYYFGNKNVLDSVTINYEDDSTLHLDRIKITDKALSGNKVGFVNSGLIYSEGLNMDFSKMKDLPKSVEITCSYYFSETDSKGSLVCSLDDNGHTVAYQGTELKGEFKKWKTLKVVFPLTMIKSRSDIFKIYALYNGSGEIWVDNMVAVFRK